MYLILDFDMKVFELKFDMKLFISHLICNGFENVLKEIC